MPIYKGNKEITAIYKGDTPISAIYKGDTLIFSSGTWEQYLYELIYNSLVPTTINNKQVKNKARVNTIYANGVIENQLVDTNDTVITLGTHKYLTKISGTWSLITGTSQTISVSGGTDMIIDLTQMFGTGNEPTSLSDNRVQKILNSGYISYNTGTYKGTDISEISTTKADTTSLATLPFKYQGNGALNAHDTMEITDTEYVFTKNVGSVDLGTLNWAYQSDNGRFYTNGLQTLIKPTSVNSDIPNIISNKYIVDAYSNVSANSKKIYETTGGLLFYYTDSSTDTPTGTLTYQLATPQVIRIPRKHLGVVDLGSLSWSYGSDYNNFYVSLSSLVSGVYNQTPNIICSKYITAKSDYRSGQSINALDKVITVWSTFKYLIVKDSSYNDATAFKTAMSGIYLFYETQDEVANIPFTVEVESGGTITTDSEVLPNVEFDIKCK